MDNHESTPPPRFTPVPVRQRHDGWTHARQVDFIEALADTGCVTDACKVVGMSDVSAYALRRRFDATDFRRAWDAALDVGIQRLADAAMGRALHGVSRPIFYKGEQVGETREFDERLTQFLLRYRNPIRFGAWRDDRELQQTADGPNSLFAYQLATFERNFAVIDGQPGSRFARLGSDQCAKDHDDLPPTAGRE